MSLDRIEMITRMGTTPPEGGSLRSGSDTEDLLEEGHCSREAWCSQRIALATVTVLGEAPSPTPELHPRCERALPRSNERTT